MPSVVVLAGTCRSWCVLAGAMAFVCLAGGVRAQETVVRLDPAKTTVQFTLGATAHTVHGTFKLKRGEIRFDPANGKAEGQVVVDARSGDTDNSGRDKRMHQEVLLSEKYSEIVFTPTRVAGAVAAEGTSQVQVTGMMQLLGREHEMTLPFTVESSKGQVVEATTHFVVPYVDWGLKNPSSFLRVDKFVNVEVQAACEVMGPGPH